MPPPFLKGYSGQTTDELLALEDNYRVDSIVLAFEEALLHKPGALDLVGDITPAAVEASAQEADESVSEILEECDNRYFDDGEHVTERLFEWIRQHRKAIRGGGT